MTNDEDLKKALGRWHSSAFSIYMKDSQVALKAADLAGKSVMRAMMEDNKATRERAEEM